MSMAELPLSSPFVFHIIELVQTIPRCCSIVFTFMTSLSLRSKGWISFLGQCTRQESNLGGLLGRLSHAKMPWCLYLLCLHGSLSDTRETLLVPAGFGAGTWRKNSMGNGKWEK